MKVKILVPSLNQKKINCVKQVFKEMNFLYELTILDSDSGVPDGQPYGMAGTFQGAQQRIFDIKKRLGDGVHNYDFIVSIENGIQTFDNNDCYFAVDFPLVILLHLKTMKMFTQFGASRPIPIDDMRKQKSEGVDQKDRGKWVNDYYERLGLSETRESAIMPALTTCVEHCFKTIEM